MAWDITLNLPYPPSVNRYWRYTRCGVRISRAGRMYRDQVGLLLLVQRAKPLAGDLEMEVDLHPPDNKRRDADNALKAILDACQAGGLYEDDYQISRILVERRRLRPGGCAIVRLRRRTSDTILESRL